MPVKVVLVSYLESSKTFKIPGDQDGSELEYLTEEFMKAFSFESNVNLKVSFQRFSPEWDQYVDLEEEDKLRNKDKLKAIVIPSLRDAAPSVTSSERTEVSQILRWLTLHSQDVKMLDVVSDVSCCVLC